MAEEITQDDKLWALLSWLLWPVAIVALLLEDKRQRPFIKYNAVQALAVGVIGYLIASILSAVVVGCFIALAVLGYTIYLGIQSYQGQWVVVPFITDFCKKQGWI
ncbi:MAG: DUF4870 domain-containing protein [Anaerolineae bacterium]|nr:DUF4870 domain-containing protein [Anaerolineae bacterium]